VSSPLSRRKKKHSTISRSRGLRLFSREESSAGRWLQCVQGGPGVAGWGQNRAPARRWGRIRRPSECSIPVKGRLTIGAGFRPGLQRGRPEYWARSPCLGCSGRGGRLPVGAGGGSSLRLVCRAGTESRGRSAFPRRRLKRCRLELGGGAPRSPAYSVFRSLPLGKPPKGSTIQRPSAASTGKRETPLFVPRSQPLPMRPD
jgi:hypothetical protein